MTAPSGPVPLRDARSMPVSLAILLAAGDASMRVAKSPFDPPLANGEIGGFGCVTGLTCEVWVDVSGRSAVFPSPSRGHPLLIPSPSGAGLGSGREPYAAAASPGAKMTAILFP